MIITNLLDAGGAFTLASVDGLDALIAGNRKVVVTRQIRTEISQSSQYGQQVIDWLNANSDNVIRIDNDITPEDRARYNPSGKANQNGDIAIKKFLELNNDPNTLYNIVTDDGDLRAYRGPGNFRAPDSTTGFVAELISDKSLSESESIRISNALEDSPRVQNNITPAHRDVIFDADSIRNHFQSPNSPPSGAVSSAIISGFNVSAMFGVGLEVLRQFGILGDILSFGVTAAHAADLRSRGETEEADRTWVRYIFETSGGVAGGVVGAAIGLAVGGPLGALVGGIALGYGAGEYGADFGDFLFDNFKQVVEPGLADLNRVIDAALSEDEDVSRRFAEAVIGALGFDLSGADGTDASDWLVARGVEERRGNGGDDILLGFQAAFRADGEVFDADAKALADEVFTAYDAAIAAGEEAELPTIDRDAGIAQQEQRLTLDGGEGDDWVFALGGEGAIVVGGEGRDLLYNSSFKGQLWGDAQGDPAGRGGADAAAGDRDTSDTFWWSAGSFIMDAGRNDRLQLFGIPVVGGSDVFWYGAGVEKGVARDFLLPWVTYGQTESGQLLIEANINQNLSPGMSEDEILQIAQIVQDWQPGDLGIELLVNDPDSDDTISAFRKAFAVLSGQLSAVYRFAANDNDCTEMRRVG